ncbi:hypothetical protein ACOMHN_016265 [Nucella lapillus]
MAQAYMDFRPLPISFLTVIGLLATSVGFSLGSSHTFRTISVSSLRVSDNFQSRSLLGCGRRCVSSDSCLGFCYNSSASICYLSEAASSATPVTLADTGDKSLTCYFPTCPTADGYKVLHNRCVKLYLTKQNYQTATNTCAQHDAHLYHFKSEVWDKPAIVALFKDIGYDKMWLGADDIEKPRTYTWRHDGKPLLKKDPLWNSREPTYDSNVNCVQLNPTYRYNDVPCTLKYYVICQIDK